MLRWLWTTLVTLPSEKDAWQFRTYSVAVPIFLLFSLYVCAKWFHDYPSLEQATVIEGVFFDDQLPTPRNKTGSGRPYCVKTSTGELVYGSCAGLYGAGCLTSKPWASYSGAPARMWVVGNLAVQMEVSGEYIMTYENRRGIYTSPAVGELLIGPGVLLVLLTLMCLRYVPMFGPEARDRISHRKS